MADHIESVMELAEIEAEARQRYSDSSAYQAFLANRYRSNHRFYAPVRYGVGSGDQWPEAAAANPSKIHVSENVIRPFINTEARVESILPRITIPSTFLPEEERKRAEAAEHLILTWLEITGWDVWLNDLCITKGVYGKAVLKPFWNVEDKRGDVSLVELPEHLRLGWGSSDFSIIDWALYEYAISPNEAERRWKGVRVEDNKDPRVPYNIRLVGDHDDPLNQRLNGVPVPNLRLQSRQPTPYEQRHVKVWDYWYLKDDVPCNAILLNGTVVDGPHKHPEMPSIPYIVIEHDHEPGSPEGVSGVEDLLDLQIELNRLVSHALQHVADEVDSSYQLTGENSASIEPGLVPKPGQIIGVGAGNRVELIPQSGNTVPLTEMISVVWNALHRMSGVPEISLGGLASADISGRAIAVQIESMANRLDPRRRRLYRGLLTLIQFWVFMAEKMNPEAEVGENADTGEKIVAFKGDLLRGFNRWKIIAPEITPRDVMDQRRIAIDSVNANLSSRESAMDFIGTENPRAELDLIRSELQDMDLNAAAVQARVALISNMQQMAITAQQAGIAQQAQGGPQAGMSAEANAQSAVNGVAVAQSNAQPGPLAEDQNAPMTQAGSPAAPGGTGPVSSTLIRSGRALNQLAIS